MGALATKCCWKARNHGDFHSNGNKLAVLSLCLYSYLDNNKLTAIDRLTFAALVKLVHL